MMILDSQGSTDIADKGTSSLDQKGYVLVTALLALCLLTLIGLWALNTSDFELKTASNGQKLESDFNLTEGAAKQEGAAVGFARTGASPWFMISNPKSTNRNLLPPAGSYDPGGDIKIPGSFPNDFDAADYQTWPRQNLLGNTSDNTEDYAYLVTYLYPDVPPKGYSADSFSGYKFRIRAKQKNIVEIGGIKVGVKAGS
jgi:hypothetical protein